MRKDSSFKGGNSLSQMEQNIKIQGLYTYPNQFSSIPDGALIEARNCIIDAPGVVESRRGLTQYGTFNTSTIETLSMFEYSNRLVTHTSNGKISIDNGSGLFQAKNGTYTVPEPTSVESRVRFRDLNQNLYFTTGGGVIKLDNIANQPRKAGAPAALGGSGVVTGTGWMPNNVNVAYRVMWQYIDSNSNLIRSAPSDRIIVSNAVGAGKNVQLTFTVPFDISIDTQQWTYVVYRSNTSSSLATSPDDNCQQVFQGVPTGPQLSARTITIIDSTPDAVKGELLYTSTEGISQSNAQPPFCTDIALFKGYTFYANCSTKQLFFLSLISGSNMVNGNTLTFTRTDLSAQFTLTAGAAENIATGVFKNETGSTPSINIATTAQSIVNVMNLYPGNNFIDAYYSSGFEETPGKMIFQDRNLNTVSFFVTCSNTGVLFNPTLPATGANINNTSTNNSQPNAVYYSKLQSPEAVPLPNNFRIGSSSFPIVRILALQDTLIIIKTEGIYKITGNAPSNFTVSPIDIQMKEMAANSFVVLNNMLYGFVDQGIVRITDSGSVELISIPINEDLLRLTTPSYPGFQGATYGVAYPPDHKYILSTVNSTGDATSTIAYVYNYVTDAWTTWNIAYSAGIMRPSNELLYFGTENTSQSIVVQERKTLTAGDYADYQYPVTIISVTPNALNPNIKDIKISPATFVNVTLNQSIQQITPGATTVSQIIAIDPSTQVINVDNNAFAWVPGLATVYDPIGASVTLAPVYGNTPNAMKQFTELSLLTDSNSFSDLYANFRSDLSTTFDLDFIIKSANLGGSGWGGSPWGLFPWGSSTATPERIRTYVPRSSCKGNWIIPSANVKSAFSRMRISGISILYRVLSHRIR
jgi:hypothetical protein